MNLTKRSLYFLLLFISVLLCFQDVKAGGWPVRRKKLTLSASANYFTATKLWDRNGKSVNYDNNGKYTSTGLFIYGEYGLTRRFTLVASVPILSNVFRDTTASLPSSGIGDVELGVRYYLFNINFKWYFGLQGSAILPLYTNTATNNLGYQSAGADLKLSGSGSIKVDSLKSYFFNVDIGARNYFATDGPFQARGAFSAGYKFNAKDQVSIGATGVKSVSTNKAFSNVSLAQIKDFSYVQASLSYGHIFSQKLSVFGGVSQALLGRNTGIGTNVYFSVATKF